jgi:NAD(P)H-flavin reductase
MTPRFMRIAEFLHETADTFTVSLEGEGPFVFKPGQFNMLYLPGVGEVPISISGAPGAPGRLVHTIRAVGSVTIPMAGLRKGDQLGVRGPYGQGWPVQNAIGGDVIVAAGGIGLAPLRPLLLDILANRKSFGSAALLYGARTPADILYRKEMDVWRSERKLDVKITVDSAPRTWKGNVGLVTSLIPRTEFNPQNTWAFICGPEVMIRFTAMELIKRGVAPERIYVSMERNMHCGVGLCGRCQHGPRFVCKDGPVFAYPAVRNLLNTREI